MRPHSKGYMYDVTTHLPYLIAIGFAPIGVMLLLVIVTYLEGSLPAGRDAQLRGERKG